MKVSTSDQETMAAAVATKVLTRGEHGAAGGFEVGAGVEAEPADPEHGRADHGERHGVRGHHVLAEAGTLADHDRADQAGDTGIDVDDGAAGKIKRAHLEEVGHWHPRPCGRSGSRRR